MDMTGLGTRSPTSARRPPYPAPWTWTCCSCRTAFRLGCTRRCLACDHGFCTGCGNAFDYAGWATRNAWRRRALGMREDERTAEGRDALFVRRRGHCARHCDYPSQCMNRRYEMQLEAEQSHHRGEGRGKRRDEEEEDVVYQAYRPQQSRAVGNGDLQESMTVKDAPGGTCAGSGGFEGSGDLKGDGWEDWNDSDSGTESLDDEDDDDESYELSLSSSSEGDEHESAR
jgi:hypothetical protein